jgi:hypothetical protein
MFGFRAGICYRHRPNPNIEFHLDRGPSEHYSVFRARFPTQFGISPGTGDRQIQVLKRIHMETSVAYLIGVLPKLLGMLDGELDPISSDSPLARHFELHRCGPGIRAA